MLRDTFKPGERVPDAGLYWVHHYQHRLAHLARVRYAAFPECAQCGDRVRFERAPLDTDRKAMWLREDVDFRHAIRDIPEQKDEQPGADKKRGTG